MRTQTRFGAEGLLLALFSSSPALAAVYAGDVWPYKVVRVEDRVEYSYDLSIVKAGKVSPDVAAEAGEEAVKAFLKALPREVKATARLEPAIVAMSTAPGLEQAPLAPSFALSPSNALAASSALAKDPGQRALPALHPDSPKVLPSLDLLLWKTRAVEDGALVAIELAAESGALGLPIGRKELWQRVLDKALARVRSEQGDSKDGAVALVARLGAARCLDPSNLPTALRATPELAAAVTAEITALRPAQARLVPRGPWLWTQELRCMHLRDRVLAEPLPGSRAGTAAVLTLLSILDGEPRLAKGYAALEALRDAMRGRPAEDPLPRYRAAAKAEGVEAALDDLPGFFERLEQGGVGSQDPRPPLFAEAPSPITHFLEALSPAERVTGLDELALAIQDGRVPLSPAEKAPWGLFREAALVPLLRPESDGGLSGSLMVDSAYRSRLVATFQALRGAHREGRDEGTPDEDSTDQSGHPVLKVRLMVPPHLELELLPAGYARAGASLRRLEELLSAYPKASSLAGVLPEGGRRAGTLRAEVAQARALLRGLELLSAATAGPAAKAGWKAEEAKAVAAARRLIAGWRADSDLVRDVRAMEGSAPEASGALAHSGVFGIGRREVHASFSQLPKVQIAGFPDGSGPFVADASATQKYLVPVLATGSAAEPRAGVTPKFWGEVAAPDRARLRALCERVGRLRDAVEAALPEALAGAQ
ncbi:MAG: hypothetical protein ACYC8T_27210 [Myxococcaceae bacterium]